MTKHHGVAKVAIAHKLAVRLYWMLRSGQDYRQVMERGSHAGQSGSAVVRFSAETYDWTPRLFSLREEFEQEIMVRCRTEYMVDGTLRLPSKVIEFNVRASGRLADARRFSNYGSNLRKNV